MKSNYHKISDGKVEFINQDELTKTLLDKLFSSFKARRLLSLLWKPSDDNIPKGNTVAYD